MTIANRKHDVVALQVYDRRESVLPNVGLLRVKDAETQEEILVDASSKRLRQQYAAWWHNHQEHLSDVFKKSKVDYVSIATDEDYVSSLMALFNLRN